MQVRHRALTAGGPARGRAPVEPRNTGCVLESRRGFPALQHVMRRDGLGSFNASTRSAGSAGFRSRRRRHCPLSCPAAHGRVALVNGAGQASALADTLHRPLDQILDVNVRDGFVYYRALKSERGRLDRYAISLNVPAAAYEAWPREEKMAFWVNAYNAFVLQTVVDRYPIRGTSKYPAESIRQIRRRLRNHSVIVRPAGTSRSTRSRKRFFPSSRSRVCSWPSVAARSAAAACAARPTAAARIMQQLDEIQKEFVSEQTMLKIDRTAGQLTVTPIISWHDKEFIAAYDKGPRGPSPSDRPSSARSWPSSRPISCRSNASCCRRTSSR